VCLALLPSVYGTRCLSYSWLSASTDFAQLTTITPPATSASANIVHQSAQTPAVSFTELDLSISVSGLSYKDADSYLTIN
jgi:hypothetical protein